ncbi:beta-ketoacyl synthase chain length factor [Ferrovibrio terrae]|uniref:beta-ketoacyl synthase chain length factor n=1 Tax=Ferrovibrio terrae TaxID=2594003 RepID=UPI0031382C76
MSAQLTFTVQDCYAWSPGHAALAEQASMVLQNKSIAGERESDVALPAMLRRRLTPSGQRLMKAALSCAGDRQDIRYVLATRDGELTRTLSILAAVAQHELPSPADFSVSVHHALLGLLSIHTKNKTGHTAVSAGPDTFGYGLLEAISCIAQDAGEPVLLLYCDEPLPEPYAAFEDADTLRQPLILALLLDRPSPAGDAFGLHLSPAQPGVARVPCLACDFLDFLLSDRKHQVAAGVDMAWEWSRAA